MEVFHGHQSLGRPLVDPAIALGNFDGVHCGHAKLIDAAIAASHDLGGDAVTYTFAPHPAAVLAPEFAPKQISTLRRRLELFAERGVDVSIVEEFNRAFASIEAERFVCEILAATLGARHVVVGYDFTFGKDRGGDVRLLEKLGTELGFELEVIEPVASEGIVASSTKVRNFVGDGNLPGARLLLGRNYDVEGLVVRGEQRGRELGWPTANIATVIPPLLPAGIYACLVHLLEALAERSLPSCGPWIAATSLGTNPTFEAERSTTLEPHLLDFRGDLYDCSLRVEFVEYLRPERRFDSIDELKKAIEADVEQTRAVFAGPKTDP